MNWGVSMIRFMDQTIRLNIQSICRPLFLLRRHSLYVDKKYKAWRVVGSGWNVKWGFCLGLLQSLIFHVLSPSDMGSLKATLASLMQLIYIENCSSFFWSQANISHFSLSNIIVGMKKRIKPEIYQSSNKHKMWPAYEYIIGVCSRG